MGNLSLGLVRLNENQQIRSYYNRRDQIHLVINKQGQKFKTEYIQTPNIHSDQSIHTYIS